MTEASRARTMAIGRVGPLLRHWRDLRGLSQLDLSIEAGVSQKHVSFVESGRSRPSPQMVIDLTEALHVPLRERNAILLAAGHAPRYAEAGLEAPVMARVTAALRRMLQQNDPFPAVVMDRHWNVVLANDAAPRFFGCFVDISNRPSPRNLLHLLLDPAGLRPFVVDWLAPAKMLLARIHREAPGHAIDPEIRQFLDHLGFETKGGTPEPDLASPLIPLTFAKGGTTLSYFSLVTTLGAPQMVAAEELRLECMIPADDETERQHRSFVSQHAEQDDGRPPWS